MTLLTIGIPTYNRAEALRRLLAVIMPECDRLGVEVLVSDNASSDLTGVVLRDFSNYGKLRVLQSARNLGFDANLLNLFTHAAGRFLWLMGDDDLPDVSKLPELIRQLQREPAPGFIFVNYRFNDGKAFENKPLLFSLADPQSFIDRTLHRATLISTNIYDLGLFKRVRVDPLCVGRGWIQLHLQLLFLSAIQQAGGSIMRIDNIMVKQGSGSTEYLLGTWQKIFIDDFSFTLDASQRDRLDIKRFKMNFYRLNVRERLFKVGRELDLALGRRFFDRVAEKYQLGISERCFFMAVTSLIRIVGYDRLKQIVRRGGAEKT